MCVCRSLMVLMVLSGLTLQVGAQEKLAPADQQQRPQIVKLGTIQCDLVEATPVVFKGRLYRFEWLRNGRGFHFVDVATGKTTKPFATAYCFGSAFVDNDVMYVTGTSTEDAWTGLPRRNVRFARLGELGATKRPRSERLGDMQHFDLQGWRSSTF